MTLPRLVTVIGGCVMWFLRLDVALARSTIGVKRSSWFFGGVSTAFLEVLVLLGLARRIMKLKMRLGHVLLHSGSNVGVKRTGWSTARVNTVGLTSPSPHRRFEGATGLGLACSGSVFGAKRISRPPHASFGLIE